jgi:hypothetical protein
MIDKLYNLKKLQTEQNLLKKQQLLASIQSIDEEIEQTYFSINNATVQTIGSISDFALLEIHKNTMREHISKLGYKKALLIKDVKKFDKIIVELNKETEQFKYIKEQQDLEKMKKILKDEENVANEFVQSRWMVS